LSWNIELMRCDLSWFDCSEEWWVCVPKIWIIKTIGGVIWCSMSKSRKIISSFYFIMFLIYSYQFLSYLSHKIISIHHKLIYLSYITSLSLISLLLFHLSVFQSPPLSLENPVDLSSDIGRSSFEFRKIISSFVHSFTGFGWFDKLMKLRLILKLKWCEIEIEIEISKLINWDIIELLIWSIWDWDWDWDWEKLRLRS